LPRFIIRLPYGSATDPVDGFDFEEMPAGAEHEHYLWAHPAWAVAMVCGQTFARYGWDFAEGLERAIDGLPLHLTEMDGTPTNMPCAEVLLTEQAIKTMAADGVMPLVSWRDRDRVVLERLHSIRNPPTALAGRWNP
jgi:type VI secretion system protein ImpC